MADQGAIGFWDKDYMENCYVAPTELYGGSQVFANSLTPKPMNGVLSGTVTEGGVPLADVRVIIFDRRTMTKVGGAFTAADGTWEVGGLYPHWVDQYVVVYQDKDGGTLYNDAIYAHLDAI